MKTSSKIFYIEKFAIENSNETDLTDIPMLMRRKLSRLDKICLSSLKKVFDETSQEIIFSSEYGEFDTLKTLISQYLEANEVSPAKFSTSVHNNFAGLFSLLNNINSSYTALSAGKNSLSAGLVKAIISEHDKVLFCYGDAFDMPESISCLISKTGSENSVKCVFTPCSKPSEADEFSAFSEFLNGCTKVFHTPCGTIERMEK